MASPMLTTHAGLSKEAASFEQDGADYIAALLAAKQGAGLSHSVIDPAGRVVHVHADGSVRASRDPASEVVG